MAVGVLVAAILFFSAADPPNPFSPDGFLCCGRPDTWTGVAGGVALTMVAAAGTVALFLLACWLLSVSLGVRRVTRRHVVRITAGATLLIPVLAAAKIIPRLDQARVAPDCDTFRADRRAVQARNERTLLGIHHCDTVIGKSLGEIRAELGPTASTERLPDDRRAGSTYFGQLRLAFEDDRIVRTEIWAPSDFD